MDQPRFDATSDPSTSEPTAAPGGAGLPHSNNPQQMQSESRRPFLGIRFDCCKTYGRIYRSECETYYVGRCPKCFGQVKVAVGQGGTSQRIFRAG